MTPQISRLIRSLIIAGILAIPVGFLAALTAPLHTPFLLQRFCPVGTEINSYWDRASNQDPTESTLFVNCVASDGAGVALPEGLGGTLFRMYYPICLVGIIAIQGVFWVRSKVRERGNTS